MESPILTPLNRDDVATHVNLIIELAPPNAKSEQGYVLPKYERDMVERFVNTFGE